MNSELFASSPDESAEPVGKIINFDIIFLKEQGIQNKKRFAISSSDEGEMIETS